MNTEIWKSLQQLLQKYPQYSDEKPLYEALQEWLEHNSKEQDQDALRAERIGSIVATNIFQLLSDEHAKDAVPSGFGIYDNIFGGFRKGELAVVAARPSMGKSLFLINVALNMAHNNTGVAFFSFDMSKTNWLTRALGCLADISTHKILGAQLTDEEKAALEQHAEALSRRNLHISDALVTDMEAFAAECRRLVKEHQVSVIFLDDLQKIGQMSGHTYINRDKEIGRITRMLRQLVNELNIAIICSSQLNRSVESRGGDKRPQLADIRDSGNIEQDADKVIFLYRPEYYGMCEDEYGASIKYQIEVIVAKNKYGPTGAVFLQRTKDFTGFRPMESYDDLREITLPEERLGDFDLF
mgnify:FL=1